MSTLWSDKAYKGFGKFVDDKVKLPAVLELLDGLIATQAIIMLDKQIGPKVPEKFRVIFEKAGKLFEDYEKTGELNISAWITIDEVVEIINTLVDIPSLTEEDEEMILAALIQGVFLVVKKYLIKETE